MRKCDKKKLHVGGYVSAAMLSLTLSTVTAYASSESAGVLLTREVQQTITIKGSVKDADGNPVIGANIQVKGTSIGTISDMDGNFSFQGPAGATVVVSYIGFHSQTIEVKGNEPLQVRLQEDTEVLNEVVVVGYGTQKKANLSGSVASVDSEQLQNRPIQNISSGLQGLMPGVTVTGTNGAPGMDSGNIRIRGIGTLNTASPYILIDGVESETMSAVDPNDIASISVLKDAASAAIYGSKAANGVILITTKRGSTGKPKVSYSGYISFQNATEMRFIRICQHVQSGFEVGRKGSTFY